jgi:hypothetical protein
MNYAAFTHEQWKKSIHRQLKGSGLQDALDRLTSDMVMSAQQRILILEGEMIRRYLHAIVNDYK